jgi:hypothetical protein
MKLSTSNPQAKPINQKRGPTTGNAGTASKHSEFMTAKAKSGNERSALANMVTDAVANRGRKMKGFRDAAVEGLKSDVNVGRGPTKGNKA